MTRKTLSLITAILLLTTNTFAEETLKDITVVSVNKTSQSIKNTTSNVTVITAEDIEENGYQTLTEAISHTSGISITNNGGLGKVSSIFLRGMKTEKILVLLDGVTLNNPSSTDGQAFFEHISLDNIEQIEIVKGGVSSIWGSDASAGIINIITKKAKDGIHGNLVLSYGSYGTKKASTSISYKNNNFDTTFSASKLKSDGFSAKIPRNDETDGYENTSANLKLAYHFNENNTLSLNYNYVDANTEYDGSYSVLGSNDPLANIDTKQKDLIFTYQYTNTQYQSLFKYIRSTSNRTDTSNSPFGNAIIGYDSTVNAISWINSYQYTQNGSISLGLEHQKTEGDYQYNTSPSTNNVFKNKAVFLAVNHTFDSTTEGKTLLEASIRKDIFDKFDDAISYKVGFKHFHSRFEGLTTSLNYYKSIDAPNSYQVANSIARQPLNPDNTKGYDVSIQYKDIKITYFSNTIDDKLDFDTNLFKYINNQGREKTSGIELDLSHTISNMLISLNYSHLLKYEDEEGFDLQRRAKETLNVSLDKYMDNKTHFGVNAQYVGDRIEYAYGTHNITANTGNYTIWNLNFGTRVMDDIDISIHAKNIFDKEYQSVFGYATEGRSIYANFKYSF